MSEIEIDEVALTAAHLAVEDMLVEFRDNRISVLGPANGFVIKERNGDLSDAMRVGTREGLRTGIKAYLAALGGEIDPRITRHPSIHAHEGSLTMPATRKVRCSDRDGCGWSGERQARPTFVDGEFHPNILTVPDNPCPRCGGAVELVGRTNPNRQEA